MKYSPHEYQTYATNFILTHPVSAILLDMGLGNCGQAVDNAYKADPAGIIKGLRECAHNICYSILNYTDVVK